MAIRDAKRDVNNERYTCACAHVHGHTFAPPCAPSGRRRSGAIPVTLCAGGAHKQNGFDQPAAPRREWTVEEAARFAGVRTGRLTVLAYVACSLLAGLGGCLFVLDVNSAQASSFGNFYELYAIAGAVLGGVALRGGEGFVIGVVLGAALMQLLSNTINLVADSNQLEFAVVGAVILLGAAFDESVQRWVRARNTRR